LLLTFPGTSVSEGDYKFVISVILNHSRRYECGNRNVTEMKLGTARKKKRKLFIFGQYIFRIPTGTMHITRLSVFP